MRTVWKYELRVTDVQHVEMPAGAQLLHVAGQTITEYGQRLAFQAVKPMLWALVDTDAPMVRRLIAVVGTGNPAPAVSALGAEHDSVYVGSAICGDAVWHVFDGGEVDA